VSQVKVAVLIAHADREPFKSVKKLTENQIILVNASEGVDTYYAIGLKRNRLEMKFRDSVEKMRWSRSFFILRLIDQVLLSKYKRRVAKRQIVDREIRIRVPEDIRHLTPKLLSAYEFLYNEGYDWVVRTTTFSIVIPRNLLNILNRLPTDEPRVGGRIVNQLDGTSFISGSFSVFNQSALRLILDSKNKINFGLIDDVALSRLVFNLGIPIFPISSVDIAREYDLLSLMSLKESQISHIRCRSNPKNDDDVGLFTKVLDEVLL
jgi:hypothetical protein